MSEFLDALSYSFQLQDSEVIVGFQDRNGNRHIILFNLYYDINCKNLGLIITPSFVCTNFQELRANEPYEMLIKPQSNNTLSSNEQLKP